MIAESAHFAMKIQISIPRRLHFLTLCLHHVNVCCLRGKSNMPSPASLNPFLSWRGALLKALQPFIESGSISRQSQDGSCAESIFNRGKRSKHSREKSIVPSLLMIHHLSLGLRSPVFFVWGSKRKQTHVALILCHFYHSGVKGYRY